jgi:hypothetical protein
MLEPLLTVALVAPLAPSEVPLVPEGEPALPMEEPEVVASLARVEFCGAALVPPFAPIEDALLPVVPDVELYDEEEVVAVLGACLLSRLSPRAKAELLTAKTEAAMNTGASLRMETSWLVECGGAMHTSLQPPCHALDAAIRGPTRPPRKICLMRAKKMPARAPAFRGSNGPVGQ